MERYVDNWFHFYETTASFQAHLKGGLINPDAICFLGETHQIYAQGTLFGICRKRYEELEELVQKHSLMLKDILGEEGPSVDNGIIDNLKEITDFLTGYAPDETLKGVLDALKRALDAEIKEVADDLAAKYKELSNRITGVATDLAENVTLLTSRIDANEAGIQELRIKHESLKSSFNAHIVEWGDFKVRYDTFYEYVDKRFHSIDENYHAQQESINRMHEEIEAIKSTVDEFDAKVEHCITLVNNCHVLVDQLEIKFDELSQEVSDFFNTKGHLNGLAPLDADGKVPSTHLPSYVDDVLEFSSANAFPSTGEDGKIYVALDTNLTYRWSGTQYVEISKSLALGETSATAYPGDKGKKTTDDLAAHKADFNNPHKVTTAQLGLDKVNNTSDLEKPISTAMQAALDVLERSISSHIADRTNPHDVTKEQVGLGNVDNTSDAEKPISRAQQDVLDTKVDKIIGKGLSTNDYTNEDKAKLYNSLTARKLTQEEFADYNAATLGEIIYNTTTNKYLYWDGTKWIEYANATDLSAHINNKNNPHGVTKAQVGLGNVDNTSDLNKPISNATKTELDKKVDKVSGKGLSTNDYTTAEKNKLAGVEAEATKVTWRTIE